MRQYLLTIVAVMAALSALAQGNRIYIEDFEIDADSTKVVPVVLANCDSTRGLQFDLTLPVGLRLEDLSMTSYAMQYDMSLTINYVDVDSAYLVFMYPSSRVCFPPDTKVVMKFEFTASSDFKGGDLLIWKCRGSTMENKTIYMEGSTTRVTVPSSTLIGIPVDQQPTDDQYFNLMGVPISSPDAAPVAIQVTTGANGERYSRKIAKAY